MFPSFSHADEAENSAAAGQDPSEFMARIRSLRTDLCVFRHDGQVPGETAALARLLWCQLPEMAKRLGASIREDEGFPPSIQVGNEGLSQMIGRDMLEGRKIIGWLHSRNHPVAPELMAKGDANIIQPMLDRFAKEAGFERQDALALEAGRQVSRASYVAAMSAAQAASR